MNNQFDELTKSLAQSATRRQALKKFGVGLAGLALACFGLANKAKAATYNGYCQIAADNSDNTIFNGQCIDPKACVSFQSADCPPNGTPYKRKPNPNQIVGVCGSTAFVANKYPCSFTV